MVMDGKPLAPKPGWLLICLLNAPQFSPTKVKDSARLL
jgi:hypothetical protein